MASSASAALASSASDATRREHILCPHPTFHSHLVRSYHGSHKEIRCDRCDRTLRFDDLLSRSVAYASEEPSSLSSHDASHIARDAALSVKRLAQALDMLMNERNDRRPR